MFQAYSAILTTLNMLRLICPYQVYFGRFRHIQNPGILVQLEIFMYITVCSEPYSGLIQVLRKSNAYSESYLGRFRHIQNSAFFRHVMFLAYSGIFTKLHKSRHIWVYFNRFRYIRDSEITGSNSINQHLHVKSGSSFKSLFKSTSNIFSVLLQK